MQKKIFNSFLVCLARGLTSGAGGVYPLASAFFFPKGIKKKVMSECKEDSTAKLNKGNLK